MIQPYKGRHVLPGQQVFAYRNLHTGMWSLMAVDGEHAGRIVAHASEVTISAPRFVVRESGRLRVIREGKKNVHAGVRGFVSGKRPMSAPVRVTYNPYRLGAFVNAETGESVSEATRVHLDSNGKAWAQGVFA
jgi:hypothetical protein